MRARSIAASDFHSSSAAAAASIAASTSASPAFGTEPTTSPVAGSVTSNRSPSRRLDPFAADQQPLVVPRSHRHVSAPSFRVCQRPQATPRASSRRRVVAGFRVLQQTGGVTVADRAASFPVGAAATLAELERDPHPLLHRAARVGAGLVAPGARRVARHQAGSGARGDARRRDVHRRRSALLDRSGDRAEHALARRRRAREAPRAVRTPVSARRRARAVHRARRAGGRSSPRRDRGRRPRRPAPRPRRPAVGEHHGARARARGHRAHDGTRLVRRDRRGGDRDHGGADARTCTAPTPSRLSARRSSRPSSATPPPPSLRRRRAMQRRSRAPRWHPTPASSCSAASRRPRR